MPDPDVRVDKMVDDGQVWWETFYRDWAITAWPDSPFVWSLRREVEDGEEVIAEGSDDQHNRAAQALMDAARQVEDLSTADFEWSHATDFGDDVEGEIGYASTPAADYVAEVVTTGYGWDIMSEGDEHYESEQSYDSPEQAISAAMERVDELPRPGQQSLEDMPGFESAAKFKRGYFHGYKDAIQDQKIAALEWDERRYDSPVGEVDDIKWWARVPGQEWVASVEYLHPDIYTVDEETYYWKVEDENTGRTLAEGNTDSEQWSKRAVEEWIADQGDQLFAKTV